MAKKKSKLKLVTPVVEQDVSVGYSVEVGDKVENYPAKRGIFVMLALIGFWDVGFCCDDSQR